MKSSLWGVSLQLFLPSGLTKEKNYMGQEELPNFEKLSNE